jgi:RNA polymerase sigma factor (sigma-70 family)
MTTTDDEPATMTFEMTARRGMRRLEHLYAAHGEEATRLAFLLTGDRELAEDLAQDAFVRVARRFRDLRGPEDFGPYLRKTVVNLCKGHWRRRKVERSYLARAKADGGSNSSELPDVGLRDAIWSELQALPLRPRSAIVLRFYEDLSEQQTAELLDCSPGAARTLMARAMATLQSNIGAWPVTDLDRELQRMLRARSDEVQTSRTIPAATLRRARIQRAMIGLGTCAAVVALGIGGFLVVTGEIGNRGDITDVAAPRVVATGRLQGQSWELSVFNEDEELCAQLEIVPFRGAEGEVNESCAAKDEIVDARVTEVIGTPLAWGSVSSEVASVETQQFGFSTLIGVDPPKFFDLPGGFGSERRLFLAFDPNGIDAVAAKDSAGVTLDTSPVVTYEPVRITSGNLEDTRWTLATRPTVDGICVTIEQTTKTRGASSGDSNTLCGFSGAELSLTQVSFDRLDQVLLFGTVPAEARRAALILEAGRTQNLRLSGRGALNLGAFYVTVVDDAMTEGVVLSRTRAGRELDRLPLCAPDSPQMLDRGSVNASQFCGDGRG